MNVLILLLTYIIFSITSKTLMGTLIKRRVKYSGAVVAAEWELEVSCELFNSSYERQGHGPRPNPSSSDFPLAILGDSSL